MSDPLTLAANKADARKAASRHRKQVAASTDPASVADRIATHFVERINPPAGSVVSGFLPIGSEIDVRPALEALRARGCVICLPCVVQAEAPLVFRLWAEGDALVKEEFGTLAPGPDAEAVEPDYLIVPMLAFDRAGFRLGYGGGFYDRSLAALRQKKTVQAVGAAYAGQCVSAVPRGTYDEPLDWIVTEEDALRPEKERVS